MRRQAVGDDDLAGPQCRGELALDVRIEVLAVHRSVQDRGCDQAVMAKARNKGCGAPGNLSGGQISAPDGVRQWPKGAWSMKRLRAGVQPVDLTRLVFKRVSSIRAAMDRHAMRAGQFGHDLVKRQITFDRPRVPQRATIRRQLAPGMIALRLGQQAPALALQDHHVVHEPRRHALSVQEPHRLSLNRRAQN